MPYLLTALLLTAAPDLSYRELCKEIREILYDAAREGEITYKEADASIRRCKNLDSGR